MMKTRLHFHFSLSSFGEGNGNPLQCSCLENPRDGGTWQAAVSGVARSRTQLKRLCSSGSTYVSCGSNGKESACNTSDLGSISGSERSPKEGNGNPLQYSCLENSMVRGAWWVLVHRVAKSQTQVKRLTHIKVMNHLASSWPEQSSNWEIVVRQTGRSLFLCLRLYFQVFSLSLKVGRSSLQTDA